MSAHTLTANLPAFTLPWFLIPNRSRLEVYFQKFPEKEGELPGLRELRRQTEPRFVVGDCVLAMAPPQSSYCVAEKNTQVDKRTLDAIARHLLDSCEGLLGNWDFKLPGNPTACIPIIVTNATLWTCAFDPAQMDLGSGDLPPAATFQPQPFVRFRKAFRHSPGLMAPTEMHHLVQVVEQGERTVFVVDARHLVPFLTGLRDLRFPNPDGTHCAHQLVDD